MMLKHPPSYDLAVDVSARVTLPGEKIATGAGFLPIGTRWVRVLMFVTYAYLAESQAEFAQKNTVGLEPICSELLIYARNQ